MSNGFYKNRRLKSLLFFSVCILVGVIPHFYYFRKFSSFIFLISFLIACYGLLVISKNFKRNNISNGVYEKITEDKLPKLDILVAARDEENVLTTLVERLFRLIIQLTN